MFQEDAKNLGFNSLLVNQSSVIISSYEGSGLYQIVDNKAKLISRINEESVEYVDRLYGSIIKYKSGCVLVPLRANDIVIYDADLKAIKKIKFSKAHCEILSKFNLGYIVNDSLILFPTLYPGIVVKNMLDESEIIVDGWIKELEKYRVQPKDAFLGLNYIIRGNIIYIPSCCSCAVLEFNINTYEVKVINIGTQSYSSICDDGKYIWLMPRRDGEIVRWNPDTGEIMFCSDYPEGFLVGSMIGCVCCGDYILAFPEYGNMVLKIDIYSGEMESVEAFNKICNWPFNEMSMDDITFSALSMHENNIYLYAARASRMVKYDIVKGCIEEIEIEIPESEKKYFKKIKRYRKDEFFKQGTVSEGKPYILDSFINYLSEKDG